MSTNEKNDDNNKDKADRDNRSRQLDSEHDAYWSSRGQQKPPSQPQSNDKPKR
jgi:hypothetical protein